MDASWPGSVHDSRIFKNSSIFQYLQNMGNHGFVLGDQGYGIAPYLMTPYDSPSTDVQRKYNRLHSTNRIIVEHAFGQLKRRFPILKYCVRVAHERIPTYISACFILHNAAKALNDPDFDEEFWEEEEEIIQPYDGFANDRQLRHLGQQRRDEIAIHLTD
jgi:nuclease HARBI1